MDTLGFCRLQGKHIHSHSHSHSQRNSAINVSLNNGHRNIQPQSERFVAPIQRNVHRELAVHSSHVSV